MTDEQMTQQQTRNETGRWAPWWVYVVVLVPANALKQFALGDAPVGGERRGHPRAGRRRRGGHHGDLPDVPRRGPMKNGPATTMGRHGGAPSCGQAERRAASRSRQAVANRVLPLVRSSEPS